MKENILQRFERRIWQRSEPLRLEKWLRLLFGVYRVITQSRIKLYAISLTYASLLAAVPLLAVLFTLLRSFGVDKFLPELIDEVLAPMGESGRDVGRILIEFVSNAQSGLLGGIGVLFLFYSIFSLFRKIEVSLNNIWSIDTLRPIRDQVFGYLGALMLIVLVAAVALGLNIFSHQNSLLQHYFANDGWSLVVTYGAKGASILVTAVMLAIIYSATINIRVKFRAAFGGGLFCAILWLPLTYVFTTTMAASTSYSLIYSSFAGLIILLVWLQILWLLFLSGALVAYFVQFPTLLRPHASLSLNLAEYEFYALQVMHCIIGSFKKGGGAVSLSQLIQETHLSYHHIQKILEPYLRNNSVMAIGDTKSDFILAKAPQELSDDVIIAIVRGNVRPVNLR